MDVQDISALLYSPLFEGADKDAVAAWLETLGGHCETYSTGQILCFQGDVYDRLILLIQGSAAAQFQDASGKIMRVETLHAPEAVASAVVFSTEQILPVTLTAEQDLRLYRVKTEDLLTLLQKDQQVLKNLLQDMGDRLAFLAEKARFLRFSTLREKTAGYLLQLSDRSRDAAVKLPYTREKLAEMFGVERPSLSREFSKMVNEGLITIEGRNVTILDREELRECIDQ